MGTRRPVGQPRGRASHGGWCAWARPPLGHGPLLSSPGPGPQRARGKVGGGPGRGELELPAKGTPAAWPRGRRRARPGHTTVQATSLTENSAHVRSALQWPRTRAQSRSPSPSPSLAARGCSTELPGLLPAWLPPGVAAPRGFSGEAGAAREEAGTGATGRQQETGCSQHTKHRQWGAAPAARGARAEALASCAGPGPTLPARAAPPRAGPFRACAVITPRCARA